MRTNNIDLIKEHEGLRLKSYRDIGGVWTIGYGHTKTARPMMTITHNEAERLLRDDVKHVENWLNNQPYRFTQYQFDALVSFGFNVGLGALSSSTLYRKAKADRKDYTIYSEFCRWIKVNGKPYRGLLKRRIKEAELFFNHKIQL